MGTPQDSERSREALLEAACGVFAEFGYRRATVREICRRAGQNASSINYHYGSKEDLYREVLSLAAPDRSGADPGGRGELPAKLRLQAFIAFFLAESLSADEEPWKSRVLVHELAAPSEMFDDLVRSAIRPHFSKLRATVSELLEIDADAPSEQQQVVTDHAFSTVGQVVFYRHSRPVVERLARRSYDHNDTRRLADHIFRVVLAGINAERRRQRRAGEATAKARAVRGEATPGSRKSSVERADSKQPSRVRARRATT